MKKKVIFVIVLVIVIAAIVVVNNLRNTPYGKLDAKAAVILTAMGNQSGYDKNISVQENRVTNDKNAALLGSKPVKMSNLENISIPGPAGPIPARIYAPREGILPVIIYYHGGGWVLGSLDAYDSLCSRLAAKTGAMVISIDYRLAPEHKFPAAVNDAYAALLYVKENAQKLNADTARIAVAGDSAGGNIAAVVSMMARDKNGPAITCQILLYPVTDLTRTNTASYNNFAKGFFLTKADMEEFIKMYTPDPADRKNPYASPLLATNFDKLPPALVITEQFDVLRDEGEAYADKLAQANVPVKKQRYDGIIHAFVSVDLIFGQANEAMELIAATLQKEFKK